MIHTLRKLSIVTTVAVVILAIVLSFIIIPSKVYADSYDVGDSGPAGGYIFYKSGSYYLEASPVEIGHSPNWSNVTDALIGTTSTAIGTGQANTNAIIDQDGHKFSVAQLCDDYELKGYTDWFCPSKDELDLIYTNLYVPGIVDYGKSFYGSSSEVNANLEWTIWFLTGTWNPESKSFDDSAIAVRDFTISKKSAKAEPVPEPWVRSDRQMTCSSITINEDNMFKLSFIYPYADNNWVRIYSMNPGEMVYEVDMPWDNPNLIVDLPDGIYTVKTFHDQPEPLQEFVIAK